MLPVSRFKGQPVGMVTTTMPWLSVSSEPAPQWLWLASWSAATYQATPPLVLCPPAVWIPEHAHMIQWERPAVEVVPLLPPFYRSSPIHHPHRLPKLVEGWISPEEVGVFQRRDKHLLLTNQIIQRPEGHAPRNQHLLFPSHLTGWVRRGTTKTRHTKTEDSSSSSSSSPTPLHLLSLYPLRLPLLTTRAPTGGAYGEWAGLHTQRDEEVWPLVLPIQLRRGALLRPIISLERRRSPPTQQWVFGPLSSSQLCIDTCPVLPVQVMKEDHPSIFASQVSSRFTLVTDYRHKKRGMGGGKLSYGGALLLRKERTTDNKQFVCVDQGEEDEEEEGSERERKDKRPVASTPVPGSPCGLMV